MSYWDFIEDYTAAVATLDEIAEREAAALTLADSSDPDLCLVGNAMNDVVASTPDCTEILLRGQFQFGGSIGAGSCPSPVPAAIRYTLGASLPFGYRGWWPSRLSPEPKGRNRHERRRWVAMDI